jgi:hypothetical protein
MRGGFEFVRVMFAICVAGAVACSDGGASGKPDGGSEAADGGAEAVDGGTVEPITEKTVCVALAATICAKVVTCGCGVTDLDACIAAQRPACERSFAGPIARVALGQLSFNGESAEKCRADYGRAIDGCASPNDTPYSSACARMFVDATAVGGQCDTNNARMGCASGTGFCGEGGACVALPAEGQPCPNRVCGGDLVCVDGLCGPMPAPRNLPAGSDCMGSSDCAAGLGCVTGKCAAAPAIGESCDDSTACARGAECAPSNDRVCQEKGREGERCMGDECEAGLACDLTATFPVCRPLLALGEACDMGSSCVAGATCNAGRCVELPAQGETCLFGQCAAGLVCDQSSQTCGPRRAANESCSASTDCEEGLACDQATFPGSCVAKSAEGEACNGDSARCEAGLFCTPDGTCQPFLAAEAECTGPDACGPQAECLFPPMGGSTGRCTPLATTAGSACGFACGGGLRCVQKQGTCVAGLCRGL